MKAQDVGKQSLTISFLFWFACFIVTHLFSFWLCSTKAKQDLVIFLNVIMYLLWVVKINQSIIIIRTSGNLWCEYPNIIMALLKQNSVTSKNIAFCISCL